MSLTSYATSSLFAAGYSLTNTTATWAAAYKECIDRGLALAQPSGLLERNHLQTYLRNYNMRPQFRRG